MAVIDPPTINNMVSTAAGDGFTLTITPPASGGFDGITIGYVKMQAPKPAAPPEPSLGDWVDGGTNFGAVAGVPFDWTVNGLDPGYYYMAVATGFFAAAPQGLGIPSLVHTCLVQADTDPVSERIIEDLMATCETITQANGYNTDVQQVERVRHAGLITPAAYPYIVVQGMEAEGDDSDPVEYIRNHMRVVVEGWLKEGSDQLDRDLSLFVEDIKRAVCADWRRSGNATTTRFQNWFKYTSEEVKPYGAVQVRFEVQFRHQRTNPAKQI